jgi:hypothetical protein
MIPPAELKMLEEALSAIETPGARVFCVRCGAELPGSDPDGSLLRLSFCQPSCSPTDGPTFDSNLFREFL